MRNTTIDKKKCSKCKEYLQLDKFPKCNQMKSGYHSWCDSCIKSYNRLHNKKRALKRREEYIKSKYGIDEAAYNRLFKEQNGRCAICRQEESIIRNGRKINLAIDHSHSKGNIRGLLCKRCNTVLGSLEDNIDLFKSAINYLSKHL